MKTSLEHLPAGKQQEIGEIVEIIKEIAKPEKIILFGSHAGDNWVEDEYVEKGATYSYISDYDFLVIIKKDNLTAEHEIASRIENRTAGYKNDVSPIIHDIDYINKGLEDGQYFFRDIVREGILLYDTGKHKFAKARQLTPEEEREKCQYYYKKWVESGVRFLEYTKANFRFSIQNNYPFNEVIFTLHQTAERLYGGILLIYTGYKPKTHNLRVYRKYSKHISEELHQIFRHPVADAEEYRLFNLFQKSYLDSRYDDDYFVSEEDLKILIGKVEKLSQTVQKLCRARINTLRR